MTSKKIIIYIILGVGVILMIALFIINRGSNSNETNSNQSESKSLISQTKLAELPKRSSSNINVSHLSEDLTPPTNKWFSGLALQSEPKAVFPNPLSFKVLNDGYQIGLPSVASSPKLITAPHQNQLQVTIDSAKSYKLTRYDELSIDISFYNDTTNLGFVTLTAGSPLVFFTANTEVKLSIQGNSSLRDNQFDHQFTSAKGNTLLFDGAEADISQANELYLSKGSYISSYILETDSIDDFKDIAENKITSANVSYRNNEKDSITKFNINTINNKPTAMTFLPHQRSIDVDGITDTRQREIGYSTLYGRAEAVLGNEFEYAVAKQAVNQNINISNLSDKDKQLLITALRRDINATKLTLNDSYFGAKSAYRASQLLQLAKQLNETKLYESIKLKLTNYLDEWFSDSMTIRPKSFYFDPQVGGIVAEKPAFGSEEFNDHHFHYGYIIYAAALLSENDSDFVEKNRELVDLLVADIANYNTNEQLPLRRNYDPYFGHSWASGSSPFDDGNNQESVSEAINAWSAVYLWGLATDNQTLSNQAQWMLSNEAASARSYWLEFDRLAKPYGIGYQKAIVSLNWGAKRDYATFFSSDSAALLGIQLIPMNPSLATVYNNLERTLANVAEALPQANYNKQFGDYILMYKSQADKADALSIAKSIEDKHIDGANSRAYMYAWIMSR